MDCRKHKQQTVFQDASWRFLPDAGKKAESLLAVRQVVAQKHIQKRPAFLEQIFCQLRFHTWQHWATQGAILLCVFLLVLWTGRKGADHTVSLSVCSVFIVFAGNICLSSIVQLFSWHMAELEMTLYFDLKQVVCIRMLEAGLFDLFLLGFLSGCLESRLETHAVWHPPSASFLVYWSAPCAPCFRYFGGMLTCLHTGWYGYAYRSLDACCSYWKSAGFFII